MKEIIKETKCDCPDCKCDENCNCEGCDCINGSCENCDCNCGK